MKLSARLLALSAPVAAQGRRPKLDSAVARGSRSMQRVISQTEVGRPRSLREALHARGNAIASGTTDGHNRVWGTSHSKDDDLVWATAIRIPR